MNFLRAHKELTTLDKIRNTEIGERLNLKNAVQEIGKYQSDWVNTSRKNEKHKDDHSKPWNTNQQAGDIGGDQE